MLCLVSAKRLTLRASSGIGEASHTKARADELTNVSAWASGAALLARAESMSIHRFTNSPTFKTTTVSPGWFCPVPVRRRYRLFVAIPPMINYGLLGPSNDYLFAFLRAQ